MKEKILILLLIIVCMFSCTSIDKDTIVTIKNDSTSNKFTITKENYKENLLEINRVILEDISGNKVTKEEQFIAIKHQIIFEYIVVSGKPTMQDIPDDIKLQMCTEIANEFRKTFIEDYKHENAKRYIGQTKKDGIDLIATAFMDQIKFGIPSSVKIAQSIIETGYGDNVKGNNYFGIKAHSKTKQEQNILTTEWFTNKELKSFKGKVVSKKWDNKRGKWFCKVYDVFEKYDSPWKSFRAHSIKLKENSRYHDLWINNSDYEGWCDGLQSNKYATGPTYAKSLKSVIKRYNLHLLDY